VPAELVEQLDIGGRLIIPVGDNKSQQLTLVVKTEQGAVTTIIEPAFFVPLKSGVIR
jgi:protein-L-isoaspartate(D-aspartate) O-methyltransferase